MACIGILILILGCGISTADAELLIVVPILADVTDAEVGGSTLTGVMIDVDSYAQLSASDPCEGTTLTGKMIDVDSYAQL